MGRLRSLALLLATAPLLAGCMNLDGSLSVSADDRVSYQVFVEVPEDVLGQALGTDFAGGLCDALWASVGETDGVELVPADRDGWRGCSISGATTVDAFPDTLLGRVGVEVTHSEGVIAVNWFEGSGVIPASSPESLEFSVTFPGPVLTHTGSSVVDGTTVTWRDPADLFSGGGMSASGGDQPEPMPLLPVLAVLAVLGLGVAAVVMRRRTRSAQPPAESLFWDAPDPAARVATAEPEVWAAPSTWTPQEVPPEAWAPTPADLAERQQGFDKLSQRPFDKLSQRPFDKLSQRPFDEFSQRLPDEFSQRSVDEFGPRAIPPEANAQTRSPWAPPQ